MKMKKWQEKPRSGEDFVKDVARRIQQQLGKARAEDCTKNVVTYCEDCTGSPFLYYDNIAICANNCMYEMKLSFYTELISPHHYSGEANVEKFRSINIRSNYAFLPFLA